MLSFYAFLNITENMKNHEVGFLAMEHCTLQLNDDRKSKGEESYRASAVIYTYKYLSWVVALKRPSGSSVKRLW